MHVVNITAAAGQLVEIAEAGTVTCVSGSDLVRPMPCCPGQLLDSYLENTSPPQWHSISARCTFREVGCIPVNVPVVP